MVSTVRSQRVLWVEPGLAPGDIATRELSATDEGDETAAALLRLVCADYLVGGARYLTQLPRTIEHALERTRLEQTVRRLQGELASRDALVEQTISERTALVWQVHERVTDAFVALDADWRYTYVNARAAQAFNRRVEDLIGKHIWTEFPEGVGQPFQLAYEQAMADQQPGFLEDYYPPFDRWFENHIYPSQLV